MAKKKIGEIYNKPIVIGDKNLMNDNEIHIDDLQGSGDGNGDLEPLIFHFYDGTMYQIDFDAANNKVVYINSSKEIILLERGLLLPNTYAGSTTKGKVVCDYPFTIKNAYSNEIYDSTIDSDGNYVYNIVGSTLAKNNIISCKEYSFNTLAINYN